MELDKGASLDEIRNKITKGKIKTKVTKHLQGKKDFSIERIQCQKRDLMHILNKYEAKPVDEIFLSKPRDLTTVELLAKEKEEQDGNPVLNKSIYKLDDKELLVFLATDSREPITIHWALSKNNAGEWSEPPPNVLPQGSVTRSC